MKKMYFLSIHILLIIILACDAGPIEEIAAMPDLSLVSFYFEFFIGPVKDH